MKNVSVAVDIGGTFTDLLAFDADTGQIHQAKCLSTPPDFATGVLDGVHKASLDLEMVESFVHGSTVAINTAIERTGALTALIVTRGTGDVYQIARGNRPESYNILFQRAEPLAPRRLTFEVNQRTTAWGEALVPFDEAQAREVAQQGARERRRSGRDLFPAFLSGPGGRTAHDQYPARGGRRQIHYPVARDLAPVGRIRAHLDHRAERLYRAADQQIHQQPGDAARRRRLSLDACSSCSRTAG